MIAEIHIVQSFGPSNLNRDDTGSPKDCVFGGVRRARISSQCIKRSIRRHPAFSDRVRSAGGTVGTRTKLISKEIAAALLAKHDVSEEESLSLASMAVQAIGPKFDKKHPEKTQYLLYIGRPEVEAIADALSDQAIREEMLSKGPDDSTAELPKELTGSDTWKALSKTLKSLVSKERLAEQATAADIALFGRMVADAPSMNVDAATQVAHAISTHEVEPTLDYFTAVDDLENKSEQTGAGMVGITEFNSACYYRYAAVDLDLLAANLAFNRDLRDATVIGFVEAAIKAIPTGKQNSTAPQSPPYGVRVILRSDGMPWALTGAFSRPVQRRTDADGSWSVESASLTKMNEFFDQLAATYGGDGIRFDHGFSIEDDRSSVQLIDALTASLSQIPAR